MTLHIITNLLGRQYLVYVKKRQYIRNGKKYIKLLFLGNARFVTTSDLDVGKKL